MHIADIEAAVSLYQMLGTDVPTELRTYALEQCEKITESVQVTEEEEEEDEQSETEGFAWQPG